jgi:hypothetical protein
MSNVNNIDDTINQQADLDKLNEQEKKLNALWLELFNEGSVFKVIVEDKKSPINSYVLETVRAYLSAAGSSEPKQYILARIQKSGLFVTFDDRDITKLKKLDDVSPMYLHSNGRSPSGIIKFNERMEKRNVQRYNKNNAWRSYTETGTVFMHTGFNEEFETLERFNLPHRERTERNEVILAKAHTNPMFVEFITRDLGDMLLLSKKPKYALKAESTVYSPRWTLNPLT